MNNPLRGAGVRIVVPISNLFHWELKPFFYFFDKFWDANLTVTVLSSRDPNYQIDNLEYMQVPGGICQEGDWYWGWFSNGIKWFLGQIPEPYVIIMMADHWLRTPVNTDTIATAVEYASANEDIFRISLYGGTVANLECTETYKGIGFWECASGRPDCFLTMSLVPALWNRKLLLEMLPDNWNPWEFESAGATSIRDGHPHFRCAMAIPPPIDYVHAARTRSRAIHLSIMGDLGEEVKKWIPHDFQIS